MICNALVTATAQEIYLINYTDRLDQLPLYDSENDAVRDSLERIVHCHFHNIISKRVRQAPADAGLKKFLADLRADNRVLDFIPGSSEINSEHLMPAVDALHKLRYSMSEKLENKMQKFNRKTVEYFYFFEIFSNFCFNRKLVTAEIQKTCPTSYTGKHN